MPKRISQITKSLKEISDINVNDFDFIGLLNKDINEIEKEIAKSLRRLGNTKVMEWDFGSALPAMSRVAHREVDIVGFIKRTASYKVLEWDFRTALHPTRHTETKPQTKKPIESPSREEKQAIILRIQNFLQYIVANLVSEPKHSHIEVREIAPEVLRFKLVMDKRDVSMLIGMEGHTASAVRRVLKSFAESRGVHALLEILSHEEDNDRSQNISRRK